MSIRYYIYDSNAEVVGPFEETQLAEMLERGEIEVNTLACAEGSEDWGPVGDVSSLSSQGRSSFAGRTSKTKTVVNLPDPPAPKLPPTLHDLPRVGYAAPVLTTLCCCLIGGVCALVYTSKANQAAIRGDEAAYESAMSTRKVWITISVIVGVLFGLLQIVSMAAQNSGRY